MGKHTDIERGLMQSLIDCDIQLPIAQENIEFAKPTNGTPWAAVWVMYPIGGVRPVTMSDFGEDEHVGVMQIDLNYPLRKGVSAQRLKADELARFYVAGRKMVSGLATVYVTSCAKSNGREVEGWWRVSMTVNWYARLLRNEGSGAPGTSTPPPSPLGGGQQGYQHVQAIASLTWTINHNLNRLVSADVYDVNGNEVWAGVQNTSLNQTVVTFSVATAGYAVIN